MAGHAHHPFRFLAAAQLTEGYRLGNDAKNIRFLVHHPQHNPITARPPKRL